MIFNPQPLFAIPTASRFSSPVSRNRYPVRDFGIGYGASTGYADGRRFSELRGIRPSRYC